MASRKSRSLRASDAEYTAEERKLVLLYVKDLRLADLREFLAEKGQAHSGTKGVLIERIDAAIDDGEIALTELLELLDEVEPWTAQHVFLFGEPATDLRQFRKAESLEEHLKSHKSSKPFRQPLPLALPEELAVSSITHDSKRIRVTAVERRDGWYRDKRYDQQSETPEGEPVELRAYVNIVSRGLIVFEWDVIANHGMLQVTQLPSGWSYEHALARFADLTRNWLPFGAFPKVNLHAAIAAFHKEEEGKSSALRSHGIEYETVGGRRVSGRSATAKDSVLGEQVVDDAMQQMRNAGVGRSGNFYFDVGSLAVHGRDECHAVIFAEAGRVNIPTSNPEEVVRHVLDRIRAAC